MLLGICSKNIVTVGGMLFFFFSPSGLLFAQSLAEYRQQVSGLIRDYSWGEALDVAMMALDSYPDDPQILVATAALMLQLGQPEDGERLIEAAVTRIVDDPDLLGVLAELKLSRGGLMGAEYLFRRALSRAPERPHLHDRLARLLFAKGEESDALKHAKRAVELDESRTDYRRSYAAMLEQAGRSEEAYQQLREARLRSPGDARILLRLADAERRSRRFHQALEYLEMAVASDPENPLYFQELARLYDTLGVAEQAEEARSRAGSLEQAFQIYAEALGLVSQGKDAAAASMLESVVNANPEFTTGAVFLADLYRKTGEKEKALGLYRSVLVRDPSRARAKEEAAWLYVERGELETALEILREANPEDVNHALLEGYQKLVEADWEGAMSRLKKAEMRYPLHPGILQQISVCLNSMGRPDEALAYLEKAHSVEPEDSEIDSAARMIRFEYGLNLEKNGRWREALIIFAGLRAEDSEVADYYFHEAYCRQNLWEYRQAIELYLRGLALEDQEVWVRINLATCFYALSLYDEAAEQWEILVEKADSPEYIYNLGLARIRQWRLKEGWNLVARAASVGFEPARRLQRSRRR